MRKFQCLLFVWKRSYYYIICMTVLIRIGQQERNRAILVRIYSVKNILHIKITKCYTSKSSAVLVQAYLTFFYIFGKPTFIVKL